MLPSRKSGFTLIELLVVIAIIGLLSSVILASISTVRTKARDAKRLSDLREVQKALDMYYSDHGKYPGPGGWAGNCSTFGGRALSGASGYIPNLAPEYIPILPIDPKQTASACYLYRSDGPNDYMFLIYKTVEGDIPDSLRRPAYFSENDFAVWEGKGVTY